MNSQSKVGKLRIAAIFIFAIIASFVDAKACDELYDNVITDQMAMYLESRDITTADLESMSCEEIYELGLED